MVVRGARQPVVDPPLVGGAAGQLVAHHRVGEAGREQHVLDVEPGLHVLVAEVEAHQRVGIGPLAEQVDQAVGELAIAGRDKTAGKPAYRILEGEQRLDGGAPRLRLVVERGQPELLRDHRDRHLRGAADLTGDLGHLRTQDRIGCTRRWNARRAATSR